MEYKVIDNFLEKEYFENLVTFFTNRELRDDGDAIELLPWFLQQSINNPSEYPSERDSKLFYMTHMFYDKNTPCSEYFHKIIPILEKLDVRCLIRAKGNLYPNTEKIQEHSMHTDYPFSHSGALLSLNTCDGYTKLADGTKIESVANRILLFNGSKKHCSTTTTNVFARCNINLCYIQQNFDGNESPS